MSTPALYIDLGSPYAYLALARAPRVLGVAPELRPVLLGAIFEMRGYGSWAHTQARSRRIGEIEARAEGYGLPPLAWPERWPVDGLRAMRCAVWAGRRGAFAAFASAVLHAEFATGADIARDATLIAAATAAGLDGGEMLAGADERSVKDELRALTAAAWEDGVRGVPSLRVGDSLFFGDDQLELAAALLASEEG